MVQREDFITRLAQKGYTKRDAAVIMDDVIHTIEEILVEGDAVMFRGFGTFEVCERAERASRDPHTKEWITIPAYRAPKFTAGKLLKREVKEGLVRS